MPADRLGASLFLTADEPDGAALAPGTLWFDTGAQVLKVVKSTAPTVWTPLGSGGGGAAWGDVTGTLSAQTDLQAALDAKGTSNFSGAYADLTGQPTLGTAAATAATDYATAAQGVLATNAAATSANLSDLANPATARTNLGLGNVNNTADASKPISTATQTALDLKAPLVSPAFTTPVLGAATGTSVAVTGGVTSSGGTMGYAAGAGGTVTQLTSKSTGVTLNKWSGTITTHTAALAAAAIVTFTVTNSVVAATDVIAMQHDSGGTVGAYSVMPNTSAAGSFKVTLRNNTAGSLSQALVLRFVVIKGSVT